MKATDRAIKEFLKPRMYRHISASCAIMTEAEGVLRDLFQTYLHRPEELPRRAPAGTSIRRGKPGAPDRQFYCRND